MLHIENGFAINYQFPPRPADPSPIFVTVPSHVVTRDRISVTFCHVPSQKITRGGFLSFSRHVLSRAVTL
jgi:hypothetical protein